MIRKDRFEMFSTLSIVPVKLQKRSFVPTPPYIKQISMGIEDLLALVHIMAGFLADTGQY